MVNSLATLILFAHFLLVLVPSLIIVLAEWVVEEGADRLLRHVSECKEGDEVVEERKAAGIEDAHVSDELAFLVQSACVLAPPAADSMPYIL